MKELIKELYQLKIQFYKLKIQHERKHSKEMNMLNAVTKQLYEVTARQELLFDEYSKTSYKKKFNNEHRRLKSMEQERDNLRTLLEKYKPDIYSKGVNNEKNNDKKEI